MKNLLNILLLLYLFGIAILCISFLERGSPGYNNVALVILGLGSAYFGLKAFLLTRLYISGSEINKPMSFILLESTLYVIFIYFVAMINIAVLLSILGLSDLYCFASGTVMVVVILLLSIFIRLDPRPPGITKQF